MLHFSATRTDFSSSALCNITIGITLFFFFPRFFFINLMFRAIFDHLPSVFVKN